MIKTFASHQLTLALSLMLTSQLFAQKISIQFTTAPSSTPSVSKAALRFDKDFAFSYTIDDATIDAITTAYPVLRGGVVRANNAAFAGLFYTDGCGNSLPFNAGIAWNTANQFGIDVHTGNVADQMTWGQLDTLYDAGWDVMNHSYSHKSKWLFPMDGNAYINEVEQNGIAVRNKTRKKINMPVFVVPANDDTYHTPALNLGHKIILDQSASTIGYGGLRVDNIQNLYGLKIHRTYLNELYKREIPTFIDTVSRRSRNGVKMWYNEFSHRVDDFSTNSVNYNFYYFKSHMESIANQYGKTGTDRMWMAPPQEVYEYLVTRETTTFTSQLASNRLDLAFNTINIPSWIRRKTLTLVVNSTADFNNVIVPAGVKMSFRGTGTQKIINLDFTNYVQGTNVSEVAPSVLSLFPNPAKNILSVDCETPTSGKVRATVYDISGKVMFQKDFDSPKFQMPTADLADGLYFLMVRQGKQVYRGKFVKNGQ
jgi:Secretion system C-terminal sorting domain